MIKDMYSRQWITANAVEIISQYPAGELTIRALHYQLVGRGMTNTMQHYKRVVSAMEIARWDGIVDFGAFSDLDRSVVGETRADTTDVNEAIETGKQQVKSWMTYHLKNRWENQPIYPELWIEKKALQAVFNSVANINHIALCPAKGYPSLTFLHEASERFKDRESEGKDCVILYFGDYDPSGEDIPRSIGENLRRMGANVDVRRFALFEEQVIAWKLPPAPAKITDSRTANWDGIGQVELDAVKPEQIKQMAQDAIDGVFDKHLYDALREQEEVEQEQYRGELKAFVQTL